MTGSAPSDVPLSSPGEEHLFCLDPASTKRGEKEKSNRPSKASSCVLDYAWER